MKKTVKISQLMDAYTDHEFFIQGESEVNMDTVKNNVVAKAGLKRKMKPFAKGLIIVAAAVFVATATAATSILGGKFSSAGGSTYRYEFKDGYTQASMSPGDYEGLLKEEDGRLYLTVGGETTDITDLIDRQTPYIYTCTNTETNAESGKVSYVIAGGTPDDYGVVDIAYVEGLGWWGGGVLNGNEDNYIGVGRWDTGLKDEPPTQSYYISYFLLYDAHGNQVQIQDEEHTDIKAYLEFGAGREDGKITDTNFPSTWREDCNVAWLIEAMLELGIYEPDVIA